MRDGVGGTRGGGVGSWCTATMTCVWAAYNKTFGGEGRALGISRTTPPASLGAKMLDAALRT